MKKSELTNLLRRCQDAEARVQELQEENDGLREQINDLQLKTREKIDNLQFVIQHQQESRTKPSAIDPAIRRVSSDDLHPTPELLRFLAGTEQ